ncbi:MAG TPA: HNH endonuclease [Candidatus Limnocylindrales bacterium]|jgi:putative restriction endonuclease
MKALVLESFLGSIYDDSPDGYEFPSRYLRLFSPLQANEPIFAVIYEPRGDQARGRLGYVGWAMISAPPQATEKSTKSGQRLWRVRYDNPVAPFPSVVPRQVLGEPIETWLAAIPTGRSRNVATFGRAVRELADSDLQQILALAYGTELAVSLPYPQLDQTGPEALVAERTRRAVEVVQRDAQFRVRVLAAYEFRCSVSGFSIGRVSRTRVTGLLDAAHIRPVADQGGDQVGNGLSLTPTLHRLFDAGLFTANYHHDALEIEVSQHLDESMITAPDGSFRMPLVNGLRVQLPRDRSLWPQPAALHHHQSAIFRP